MVKRKSSILSNLEKNYGDTKSIAKSVDLSALENNVNPHTLYNKIFKKVDNTPKDYPTEKISVGDIVYLNNNINNQFEIININNKSNIVLKNLDTNEVIEATEKDIKPVMESIDMAKKKLNETQYSVSINGLETTDANALSQMMSAAALADSGSADVDAMDMTSTPELPTPDMDTTLPTDNLGSIENPVPNAFANPDIDTAVDPTDTLGDNESDITEPAFDETDEALPSEIENPLDNPEPEMDMSDDFFEDDIEDADFEPVSDDIEFDEEITNDPVDDMEITEAYNGTYQTIKNDYLNGIESRENAISALIDMGEAEDTFEAEAIVDSWSKDDQDYEEIDDMEITESQLNESRPDKEDFLNSNFQNIDENVLQELYEIICDQKGDDYLSDYDDVDYMELVDCVKDFGNDIEGFDESLAEEYANALQEKWKNENTEDGSDDYTNYDRPNWEDDDLEEDVLLPKETEDETYNANKALRDKEDDEESERISESMDALIKSILENADAKSAQETYADEITEEKDDSKCCPKCGKEKCICKSKKINEDDDLDSEISEALKNAGVQLNEFFKYDEPEYDEQSDDSSELEKIIHNMKSIKPLLMGLKKHFAKTKNMNEYGRLLTRAFHKVNPNSEFACANVDDCIKGICSLNRNNQWDIATAICDLLWVNCSTDEYNQICDAVRDDSKNDVNESVVKPTIVTDESTFANKPNKALKPDDEKEVKKFSVDTATFGKDASEGFKEPVNCIKCESIAPKEKIKKIYETAKVRYAKADKSQWNALDRRYITKLIENGCGYTRASKIILEAKKKK